MKNKYLFILSPPLSGSSLLQEYIAQSNNVSSFGVEGQFLPELKDIMLSKKRWSVKYNIDWSYVKKIYRKKWNIRNRILLEKSPPNLLRSLEIEREFDPSYFIVLIRNPYFQCESLVSRKWAKDYDEAAKFWVKTAKYQITNLIKLKRVILIRYEDLMARPDYMNRLIKLLVPEVGALSHKTYFKAHNKLNKQIYGFKNQNNKEVESRNINIINNVLKRRMKILEYFGYEMLK